MTGGALPWAGIPVVTSTVVPRGSFVLLGRPVTKIIVREPYGKQWLLAEMDWQALLAKHRHCCGAGVRS